MTALNVLNLFRRVVHAGRLTSLYSHAYWGRCSHCDTTAPWLTNAWTGEYRCSRCGADQLASEA